MQFNLIDTAEKLQSISEDWQALTGHSGPGHYNQAPIWAKSGWAHVASERGRNLAVIAGYDGNELKLVWPLSISSAGSIKTAQALGPETSEYRDVLVDEAVDSTKWIQAAYQYLKDSVGVDVLSCPYVRADSKLNNALPDSSHYDIGVAPYIDMTEWDSWDSYFASRKKSFRSRNRNLLKKLEQLGEVSFKVVDSAEEARELVSWIMQLKREWTERAGIVNRWFDGDSYENFLLGLIDESGPGPMFITTLELDGKRIAAALGFYYKGKIESYFGVYDDELRQMAPGRVLDYLQLKWAFENGAEVFDFRLGNEEYKYKWINQEMQYFDYRIPLTLKGHLLVKWQHSELRNLARNVFTLMPESLRQRLKPV